MRLFGYKIVDAEVYNKILDADNKTKAIHAEVVDKLIDMTANADACKSNLDINKKSLDRANDIIKNNVKTLRDMGNETKAAQSYITQLEHELKQVKFPTKVKPSGKKVPAPKKKARGGKK